ncbi:hypothetical protein [Shimazuella kribbensis]|uniref:hypothetical protein n=1 Tax=Shimazuella kribbensis TaxID=139808 RepID=UPI000409A571|nr:hypothetical protein [Shimazuella kribbensis]
MKMVNKLWNAFTSVLTNRKGSPTVEYVILIGVGAAVAGLLAVALSGDNNKDIVTTIADKIKEIIDTSTTPTGGETPKTPGNILNN